MNLPNKLGPDLKTYLAWKFDEVIPGTFRRNKAEFAHHEYPIVAPLPTVGGRTAPLERSVALGPYVYFVLDSSELVRYVGKSLEKQVIQRWIRPGVGGPATHYWTHSTRSGGTVFNIAQGILSGQSPCFSLRYVPLAELDEVRRKRFGIGHGAVAAVAVALAEQGLILELQPDWNCR